MSDKNIPEPWIVEEYETPNGKAYHIEHHWTDDSGEERTDEIAEVVMDYRGEVARKNADVLAASAEMLAAAEMILKHFSTYEAGRALYPALCKLQDAVNKATGKLFPDEFNPVGVRFFDARSGREMVIVNEGSWSGWLVYKHHDGQWVSLRKATQEDIARINKSVVEAYHGNEEGESCGK